MNILPSLKDVEKIAESREYNVVPVSCEILSDICTPIEALRILKNVSTHCYMLESVTEKEKWGRYTFLGFDPKLEITCADGDLKAGNIHLKTEDPSAFLRQILADYKSPASIIFLLSPAGLSVISLTTTWATVSRRCGWKPRTVRILKMWI